MPYVLVPEKPEFDEWALKVINGRQLAKAPTRRRSRWGGHLIINPDGTTDTLINVLAEAKYGEIPKGQRAYWLDANPFHINMHNVALLQWEVVSPKKNVVKQHIEATAGTPEYYQEYRRRNRQKRNEYMKKRYHKMKAALDAMERTGDVQEKSVLDAILEDLGIDNRQIENILEHEGKFVPKPEKSVGVPTGRDGTPKG
jgi:hypothetical protein